LIGVHFFTESLQKMVTIMHPFMPNLRIPPSNRRSKLQTLFKNMPDDIKHEILTFLQPVTVAPMTQINISYLYIQTLIQNYSIKFWAQRLKNIPKTLKNFNTVYEFVILAEQIITEKANIKPSAIFCDVRFANMAVYDKMDNFRDDCSYNFLLCMHYERHKKNPTHMRYHYQSDATVCRCLSRHRALIDTVYKVNHPSIPTIFVYETERQSLMDSTRDIFVDIIHIAIYEYYKTHTGIYKDGNRMRRQWLYDNERKILRIMLFLLAQKNVCL